MPGLVAISVVRVVVVVVLIGRHQIGPRSLTHPLAAEVVNAENGRQANGHQVRQNARVRAGTSQTVSAAIAFTIAFNSIQLINYWIQLPADEIPDSFRSVVMGV